MTAAPIIPETIKVDGCMLSYWRRGAGPSLLFLHGTGGITTWSPWMERLAASYNVIAPDHPGWGRSETPTWFDNIHDLAYFYLDVIEAFDLKNVHLVGNSIGGWIACEMAVRNTGQIATMTLLAPAGLRVTGVKKVDIFLSTPDDIVRALYYDQSIAEQLLAQAIDENTLDILLRNRLASARVGWQPRLYDPHLAKWMHRIDVPTLVIWGENDNIIPAAMQPEFLRLIPHARGVIIPNCGHLPQAECTDAFLDHFLRFAAGFDS